MAGTFSPSLDALRSLGTGPVHYTRIAEVAGLEKTSVANAFNNHVTSCRDKGITPSVVSPQRGMWQLNEDKQPAPQAKASSKLEDDIYERIATTSKGTIIVRGCDTRTIYRLTEMDF
jgi:hypothetical protein